MLDIKELSPILPEPVLIDEAKDSSPKKTPIMRKVISLLYKIQKYSAFSFLPFYGLHTTSVILLPGLNVPMDTCQETFEIARAVYLPKIFESLSTASVIVHVASGVLLRWLKRSSSNKTTKINNNDLIDKNFDDDSYGLGGVTSLIGLGSRRAFVSQFTHLSPISFSGYVLAILVGFHYFKFKYVPLAVEGDNSLVSLHYIGVVLNNSLVKYGNVLNFAALIALIGASSYHITSGLLKYQRKTLAHYKKLGYGLISSFSALGLLSVLRFKSYDFDDNYLFSSFIKYVTFSRI